MKPFNNLSHLFGLSPATGSSPRKKPPEIRGVTRETLRRMSDDGVGPRRIQLSPGRFGYLASDFLEI